MPINGEVGLIYEFCQNFIKSFLNWRLFRWWKKSCFSIHIGCCITNRFTSIFIRSIMNGLHRSHLQVRGCVILILKLFRLESHLQLCMLIHSNTSCRIYFRFSWDRSFVALILPQLGLGTFWPCSPLWIRILATIFHSCLRLKLMIFTIWNSLIALEFWESWITCMERTLCSEVTKLIKDTSRFSRRLPWGNQSQMTMMSRKNWNKSRFLWKLNLTQLEKSQKNENLLDKHRQKCAKSSKPDSKRYTISIRK